MSADLPDWIREKLPAKSGPADVIQIIDPNDLKGLDEGQLTQIAAVNNILEPSGLIRDVSIALNSSIRAQGEALEVEKTSISNYHN